jgi:tripartite-type tricarboxylate transporter receptor subunit TctC
MYKTLQLGLAVAALCVAIAGSAAADDFFKGRVISLFAGRPPGGGVDSEMRLVAQFLGDNIPGHPRVIAQNMPGAGGIVLGNYLYNVAPKDGLTLAVPGRTAFLLAPVVGNPNVKYVLPNFTWIGSAASSNFILWLRKGAGITTVDQLRHSSKTLIIGGSGSGNSDTVVPELMAKYEKFPFKVIRGYPGTAEQALAMQSGEIDGSADLADISDRGERSAVVGCRHRSARKSVAGAVPGAAACRSSGGGTSWVEPRKSKNPARCLHENRHQSGLYRPGDTTGF